MTKKIKGLLLGERIEWLVLALILSVGLLLANDYRSQGVHHDRPGKCLQMTRKIHAFSDGPATSVVRVQPNFHIVAPGIWRSAKVNPESLTLMKTYGLKTIVNLRLDGETEPWEDTYAKKLGVQCFHFPLSTDKVVPSKTVDAVLSILSDPARQPVLVHCTGGRDRSGMIVAAYRIANTNWVFSDIFKEMMMYGYDAIRHSAMLETLEFWSTTRGRPEVAQEVALTVKKISEQQTEQKTEQKTQPLIKK